MCGNVCSQRETGRERDRDREREREREKDKAATLGVRTAVKTNTVKKKKCTVCKLFIYPEKKAKMMVQVIVSI
jgi:hypothetical protein